MENKSERIPCKFLNHNKVIVGTLHLVKNAQRAALLLPGWNGVRYGPQRILVKAGDRLSKFGITCLRFDFSGRGDSEGEVSETTIDSMISDSIAACKWLKQNYNIKEFIIIGLCSGANVSLGAASLLEKEALAVVAWSLLPFMEHKAEAHGKQKKIWKKIFLFFLRKILNPDAWKKLLGNKSNLRGAAQVLLSDKEGNEIEKTRKTSSRNILADFSSFTGKCLLIYGTRDPEAEDSCRFFSNWMNKNHIQHETKWITGAPHNFYTCDYTREVLNLTIDWLKKNEIIFMPPVT